MRTLPILACCLLLLACGTPEPPPAPPAATERAPSPRCQPVPAGLEAACTAINAGDAIGARLALRALLDDPATRAPVRRAARRLLAIDGNLLRVEEMLARGETFLADGLLDEAARGGAAADEIARWRTQVTALDRQLAREAAWDAAALARVLEIEKLARGDYPLARADAEPLLAATLAALGNRYTVQDWQPTLRGYRLLLQDSRSGALVEVAP